MATVAALTERVRLVGLSLANAARKGDTRGIAKWAHQLADAAAALAVAADPVAPKVVVTPAPPVVPIHALTYDEETEIFLDAEDEVLKSLGRPYGREGLERGALPLETHIALARSLNLPLHAAEFESFIQPGTSQ